MIKIITYEECLELWKILWNTRKTPITPTSYMKFPSWDLREKGEFKHEYANGNEVFEPTFLGYFLGGRIVGVNSFHNVENTTRSRGLYVFDEYRHRGIGTELLKETIRQGTGSFVWSYPKKEALGTYIQAGFVTASAPIYDTLEDKINFYVVNKLNAI